MIKPTLNNLVTLIISLVITLAISTPAAAQTLLRICHEFNKYPPYIYQETKESKGILIDIVDRAAADSNVQIEFYARSWKRCQKDVVSGYAHALFAMILTEQRKNSFAFPPENKLSQWYMWLAQYPVFVPDGVSFSEESYRINKGMGAPTGYVVRDMLERRQWLSPYQYEPEDGLKMLAKNKLDGYVVERLIGVNLLKNNRLMADVNVSSQVLLESRWFIPFNNQFYQENKSLVEQFWHNIGKHRQQIERQHKQG